MNVWGDGGVYGAWAEVMDRWARGEPADPVALPTLTREHFDPDTWARLSNRITAALNDRLVAWAAATTRGIGHAQGDFATAQALAQARSGLRAIRAVAGGLGLPEDLRAQLLKLVDDSVRQAQHQLERQVEDLAKEGADRRHVEQRLRIVRDNALTAILTEPMSPPAADDWRSGFTDPPRRRVIPG